MARPRIGSRGNRRQYQAEAAKPTEYNDLRPDGLFPWLGGRADGDETGGAGRAPAAIDAGDDVVFRADECRLTRYRAKRSGALERLIAEYGIIVLGKPQWDAMKREVGEAIYR